MTDDEAIYRKLSPTQPGIRPTKLEIPGWAGERHPSDSPTLPPAMPFHCKPFVDAASLGYEIPWSVTTETIITANNGKSISVSPDLAKFTGNSHSIAQFAPRHYGINTNFSLTFPPGYSGLILPHPRWFSDPYGSQLPDIIPGIIEFDWWPRMFFVVSSLPLRGQRHILKHGEPFCQVVPIKRSKRFNIREADSDEAAEIERRHDIMTEHSQEIATVKWESDTGHKFSNFYKILASEMATKGSIDWERIAGEGGDIAN